MNVFNKSRTSKAMKVKKNCKDKSERISLKKYRNGFEMNADSVSHILSHCKVTLSSIFYSLVKNKYYFLFYRFNSHNSLNSHYCNFNLLKKKINLCK